MRRYLTALVLVALLAVAAWAWGVVGFALAVGALGMGVIGICTVMEVYYGRDNGPTLRLVLTAKPCQPMEHEWCIPRRGRGYCIKCGAAYLTKQTPSTRTWGRA